MRSTTLPPSITCVCRVGTMVSLDLDRRDSELTSNPDVLKFLRTSSTGVSVKKHRSALPGCTVPAFGSNSLPERWRLIFCWPKTSACLYEGCQSQCLLQPIDSRTRAVETGSRKCKYSKDYLPLNTSILRRFERFVFHPQSVRVEVHSGFYVFDGKDYMVQSINGESRHAVMSCYS